MIKRKSRYSGDGRQMALDVVSHLMMRFFFKDEAKNKAKTTRLKEDFIKDMNFTLMTGIVTKATNYFNDLSEKDKVSQLIYRTHR